MARLVACLIAVLCLSNVAAYVLSLDASDGKPVAKVVSLLESMSQKLEDDMKEKMDCWCKTNTEDKTASAAAAQEKIAGLNALVEELPAKIDLLSTQIRSATVDLNKNKATMEKAAAIREQQEAHFLEDNASITESLEAVNSATAALNSSASAEMQSSYSLAQTSDGMKRLTAGVQRAIETRGSLSLSKLSKGDRMLLDDFLKEPARYVRGSAFLQKSEPTGSSSQIVGIMQAIADDFADDLQKEISEEATNKKSYMALMAAKTTEGKVLDQQILDKEEEKAKTESSLEAAKKDIKITTSSLGADVEFQATVEKRCAGSDAKFQERIATRAEEMAAVSKTLQVLRKDETRDLLSKTVSFLQQSADHTGAKKAQKVGAFLVQQGQKLGVSALVSLGLQSRLDSFTKVKEAIDSMTDALKKQKNDEAAHYDMCVADLAKNGATAEEKDALKVKTEQEIVVLKTKIEGFEKDAALMTSEIAEMQKQIQIAGETRQKENIKFQEEATGQKETQTVLKKAVQFLKSFYSPSSLVQIKAHNAALSSVPGAPEDFQDYQKNAGGSDAVALIESIITDARRLETEAVDAEQDAQASYEEFVAQTAASIKAKTAEVDGKTMELADAKNDKAEAESSHESTVQEIEQLMDTKASLHEECDFFVKNFEVRQTALSNEMEALSQAKDILS